MTTIFDERERGEETRFRHAQDLAFKIRGRRDKMFELWIARDHLGLAGAAAESYAKDVVIADLEEPGDADMLRKVRADLDGAGRQVLDRELHQHLGECETTAREQVMRE